MGKTLTPDQEIQQLKDLIREAHETLQDLRATVREARQLVAGLVSTLEKNADQEIRQLANWIQTELNRHAVSLNADVARARKEILHQLTLTTLEQVPGTDYLRFRFGAGTFAETDPLPYPDQPVKDIRQ